MDLHVVNQYGAPVLYRNTTDPAGAHWLEVRLRGRAPNTDACGAGLQVTAGGRTQLRQVFCGSISLGAGSGPAVHVGLGASVVVDSVQIVWPDGVHQTLSNVPADRVLEVAEP